MEELGKKRLVAAGAVIAGLSYFLICAFPLQKELILVPIWTRKVAQAPSAPGSFSMKGQATLGGASSGAHSSTPIPFRLGDRYGYFTAEGSILFAASAPYGVAIASDAFATYDRLSDGFTIESPEGADLARVSAIGYPFFASGRRFVIGPDQATISELTRTGASAWTYRFPSIVTAFDACTSLAVFGLMDGSIVGLDQAGKAMLNFAPGGSRIMGVYGVAASPDGLLVAAVTGLDRQRLVVMEKRSTAYRVVYHRYLASDYRRPVTIAFTSDGRRLEYESPSGVGVYDRAARAETEISAPTSSRLGLTTMEGGLLVLLSGDGEEKRLICAALPDRRVIDVSLRTNLAFIETRGNSLFLGVGDDIVRMDLQDR